MNWLEREAETSGDILDVKGQRVSSVTWQHPPQEDPAAYVRLSEAHLQDTGDSVSSGSHARKRSCLRQKGLQKGNTSGPWACR